MMVSLCEPLFSCALPKQLLATLILSKSGKNPNLYRYHHFLSYLNSKISLWTSPPNPVIRVGPSFVRSCSKKSHADQLFEGFDEICIDVPWEANDVWSTFVGYLFMIHIPLSFGGLSTVSSVLHKPALDPPTMLAATAVFQSLELFGASSLLQYATKRNHNFYRFLIRKVLLPRKNWVKKTVIGVGFLISLVSVTSILADMLIGPKRMIPLQEFASNSSNVSDFSSSKVAASPSNFANWLPSGWNVETRMKSSGTAYKVYKDPDTGMKFYSRTKVLECLQNPTPRRNPNKRMQVYKDPDTGMKFYSRTKVLEYLLRKSTSQRTPNKRMQVAASPSNSANWLPPGWTVETRFKGSGTAYKVYKDLDTGMKFYSRTKVLEYLQNPTPRRTPSRTPNKRMQVYVEKSTGRKFYSKRQALDYLKPSNSSSPETKDAQSTGSEGHPDWSPQGWKTDTETDDGAAERKYKVNHTKIEVTDVEGLPPGWFKAIRYKESKVGLRYKVADALRYIDNGHIKDCRVRPTLWSKISNDIVENKFHSQPTTQERELKQEGRKGKTPLFSEENYEEKSEEDIIDIDDSDEEDGSTPKEMRVKRPLFSEEISENKSEDVTEPDDLPIGAEKAVTAEMEKEKMPEAPVLKRTRVKVCATKGSPSLRSSKSTSPKALPSNPSSVNPVQTNQKDNGENPESEQKKDIPEQASSQQVDEVSPSSLLGEPSLDSSLEFAYKTLTEDILVLDKDGEI